MNNNVFKDKQGFFSIFDGILAIFIVFIALLSFNSVINFYYPSVSYEMSDFKTSNDVLEIMALKMDENSYSILDNIIYIIENNNNSFEVNDKINIVSEKFLNETLPNDNYLLTETNILNDSVIALKGDINTASNITSAKRTIGNYSFTLFIF
ncbi:hypothetical protein MBCUT_18970 [Methanobrevibacter cuticularis]|uniref:Uncharacterized protein n=1 Tax=Methanobrevibacter cuticularis TaxID=47311 RepID=A0A166CQP8_9EURY|nr:hypothetical protein [Methanobrevibacter cuticularis]KZX14770.1 hypothetical protein MBCUT_18970 [Methanobrevibacter cuticularis]